MSFGGPPDFNCCWPWDSSSCPIKAPVCYSPDDTPHGHDATPSTPHPNGVGLVCLGDPVSLGLPERTLGGWAAKRKEGSFDGSHSHRTANPLISLPQLVRVIFL